MALGTRQTQILATSAVCAALYAIAKALTAFVPTPWGVGQFAPGVVVPALFAVISGPLVGAVGAAIGVFLGDLYLSTLGFTTPLLSLTAGVPANFVGFYLLGYMLHRSGSWRVFSGASLVSLLIGNLIAASVVVFTFLLPNSALDVQLATTLGLTLFWLVTMLPFVLALVPLLTRAVSRSLGTTSLFAVVPEWEDPGEDSLILDSAGIALLFLAVLLVLMFTPLGESIGSATGIGAFWLKVLVWSASVSMIIFGPLVGILAQPRRPKNS